MNKLVFVNNTNEVVYMFTRKKSFYQRKTFYVIIAVVLAFGYWINQMPDKQGPGNNVDTNVNYPVEDKADKTDNMKTTTPAIGIEGSNVYGAEISDSDENDTIEGEEKPSEYYLVKEIDGIIKVFHYDAQGNERLLQNTDISFSLLSESDQQMFSKGVILSVEEELTNLLQDFES